MISPERSGVTLLKENQITNGRKSRVVERKKEKMGTKEGWEILGLTSSTWYYACSAGKEACQIYFSSLREEEKTGTNCSYDADKRGKSREKEKEEGVQ